MVLIVPLNVLSKSRIENNKMIANKEGENIKVSLKYDASQLASLLDANDISNTYINAELLFDKDGQILSFEYDLKEFLLNLLLDSGNNVVLEEDSLVFTVEGKLLRTTLEDIYISESNEYEDANDYINDFYARGLPYQEA